MKITAIDEQKKNKNRLNVSLDGRFAFGVHLDVLLDHHLKIGDELDDSRVEQIKTDDAFRQTYDKAIGFLSRRPRSVQEVKQYLREKLIYKNKEYLELESSDQKEAYIATQNQSIDQIVDRLTEQKLIDDVAFAKWWIDNRQQFRPRGKRLLLLELKTKGLSNQDIQTALTTPDEVGHFSSEVAEGEPLIDEQAAALKVAQKYFRRVASLPQPDRDQKLSRHLASKGFDWDTISEVLKKLDEAE